MSKKAFFVKFALRIKLAFKKFRFTPFCVKTWLLPFFKDLFQRNQFCVKSARILKHPLKNCVLFHSVLETSFCKLLKIFCQKMCFV